MLQQWIRVVPRAEVPARPALTRQAVVDATMAVMAAEGLPRATMRRVAQELQTGPASLYVHVRSTAELHAAVLDEVLRGLPTPRGRGWQHRVERLVTDYRDVLLAHPGLARSALVLRPSGPGLLAVLDRLVGLLLAGGAGPGQATWGADLLLLAATATAAEHAAPQDGDGAAGRTDAEAQAALVRAVRGASATGAPHLAALAATAVGGTPEQRWRWQLRVLLAGVLATPQPVDH